MTRVPLSLSQFLKRSLYLCTPLNVRGGGRAVNQLFRYCSSSSQSVEDNSVRHNLLQSSLDKQVRLPYVREYASGTRLLNSVKTEITELSNGLRVASEPKFGEYCTIGVCIDSGSRYEVAYPSGVTHFIEKLAFCTTDEFDSRESIFQSLEPYGGIIDCQSNRDTFLYAGSVSLPGAETLVKILSEAVHRPKFTDEEMELGRMAIKFELDDCELRPDQEPWMIEAIHAAAYDSNTLGLPKKCPEENIEKIDAKMLFHYLSRYHTPKRMVLAGVGIDHATLVKLGETYFNSSNVEKAERCDVDKSIAQYTGGFLTKHKDLSDVSLGPTPMPELAHLTLGFESVAHNHPDFVATCLLHALLGGGGSFSAGGPGKGMYTRLYTQLLNHYHWAYSSLAVNHAYGDSSLFSIASSAPPENLHTLARVVTHQLTSLLQNEQNDSYSEIDLKRAKKQLQSMLLMNLESRPLVFEDVSRHVLSEGFRPQPHFYIDAIEKVGREDIDRVVRRMLKSNVSVACCGNTDKLPEKAQFEEWITAPLLNDNNDDNSLKRRFFNKLNGR